jgi:Glycerophosphoryl diester phosphodiesterase
MVSAMALPTASAQNGDKIVIAHRGASGYLPEHTLEAYAMAYALGANYIEPDLVLTHESKFICLHDIHLERTTNVEEVFPDRHREDGRWYAADFTLEEIRQLNVHERCNEDGTPVFPGRFPMGDSQFEVPTFTEMIELIQGLNKAMGRDVGIYPEIKEPSWHEIEGLPMEEALLNVLNQYGYEGQDAKVYVQCFEPEPLKKMRFNLTTDLPLVQLS